MNYTYLLLFLFSPIFCAYGQSQAPAEQSHTVLQEKINSLTSEKSKKQRRRAHKELINFYFDNQELIDIINFLASLKEVNVVLPIGANAITSKVTLHLEDKITVDEAWDILYTLLDIAGYSMIAKENTYNIVKTTNDVARESLPLYIVKPDEIPDTDKRIRYLYYFSNIKLDPTLSPNTYTNDIASILVNILPVPPTTPNGPTALFMDAATNSMVITDKANNIKSVMKIVSALDKAEAQEKPELIKLRYINADFVANLFNEQLLKTAGDANQARLNMKVPNNATYFKKVRLVPDMRTNSIIVIGKPQAVERVREFIHNNIDVELESGKSILHTYQLQYLDARKFASVLDRIVRSENIGGTEQSRGSNTTGGPERFFEGVFIRSDFNETVSGEQPGSASQGTNTLIIAARNEDWERIKRLIEELDTPQPQVIIEVLIADLSLEDLMSLGMSVRNPLGTGLPNGVNFQSAQVSNFLTNSVSTPTTIQTDLLRRAYVEGPGGVGVISNSCDSPGPDCFSAAKFFPAGTTLFSFNDAATGKSWGIAQVRKLINTKKVLSQPHLIATNNHKAVIEVRDERLAQDQGSGSTGGTTTQTRKWITASLSVEITPRISSADTVKLEVNVKIEQFNSANFNSNNPNTANRATRNVLTNANIRNGNILALGGLTRVDSTVEQTDTPLLSRIPIIGWLFKDRTNNRLKNNLTVFISPTIIEPRLRGGVGAYTKNHVQLVKSYTQEGMLFDNLRDPITRWFFNSQRDDTETAIDDFISQDEFIAPTVYDVHREHRVSAHNDAKTTPTGPVVTAHNANSKPKTKSEQASLKTMVADIENPFTPASAKA